MWSVTWWVFGTVHLILQRARGWLRQYPLQLRSARAIYEVGDAYLSNAPHTPVIMS